MDENIKIQPGDFILFHGPNWFARLIRFGQALRFRGEREKYAYWNHAAIVVDIDSRGHPVIVEAAERVKKGSLWQLYDEHDFVMMNVDVPMSEEDRAQVVEYANAQVGESYDYLQIIGLAFNIIFGTRFSFGDNSAHICSGLVAEALERAGYDFDKDAEGVMPADLAEKFDV